MEIIDAIDGDFADREPMRRALWNRAPKYDNDHAEADAMTRDRPQPAAMTSF